MPKFDTFEFFFITMEEEERENEKRSGRKKTRREERERFGLVMAYKLLMGYLMPKSDSLENV